MTDKMRKKAEERLRMTRTQIAAMPAADALDLVHELQVHQIELEMQNEALRESEQELAAARDQYADLYEFAPVGYVALDADRTIRRANLTIAAMLGKERDALLGVRLELLLAPEWRGEALFVLLRNADKVREGSAEVAFQRADGSRFWATVRVIANAPDGPRPPGGCRAMIVDISARKEAEEALREARDELEERVEQRTRELAASEQRYRELVENTEDVVYAMDRDGTVRFVSPQVERYGFRPRDVVGRHWLEFVAAADRERVEADWRHTLETGDIFPSIFRLRNPDRRLVWVEERGHVREDEAGRIVGLTGVLRDITERVNYEKEIRRQAADLRVLSTRLAEAQDTERQRIAAGLHDVVSQLLAACRIRMAEAEACDDAESRKQALEGASDLLDEAGNEIRAMTFALSSETHLRAGLVGAIGDLCSHMNRRFGMDFKVRSPDPPPEVPEPMRAPLYHCIRELLYNVVKHADTKQAVVKVECPRVRAPANGKRRGGGPEEAGNGGGSTAARRHLRITVVDEGAGFDPAVLDRPLTRNGGFGLYNLRERLHAIHGTLRLESKPGQGTRAIVTVPVEEE